MIQILPTNGVSGHAGGSQTEPRVFSAPDTPLALGLFWFTGNGNDLVVAVHSGNAPHAHASQELQDIPPQAPQTHQQNPTAQKLRLGRRVHGGRIAGIAFRHQACLTHFYLRVP